MGGCPSSRRPGVLGVPGPTPWAGGSSLSRGRSREGPGSGEQSLGPRSPPGPPGGRACRPAFPVRSQEPRVTAGWAAGRGWRAAWGQGRCDPVSRWGTLVSPVSCSRPRPTRIPEGGDTRSPVGGRRAPRLWPFHNYTSLNPIPTQTEKTSPPSCLGARSLFQPETSGLPPLPFLSPPFHSHFLYRTFTVGLKRFKAMK